MVRPLSAAMLACAGLTLPLTAGAHGIAGARIFPATLTIDDPAVGDELSFPTIDWQPNGPTSETDIGFEWDKTILSGFGFAFNDGYSVIHQPGTLGGNNYGWDDPVLTLKYEFFRNEPHEILMSIGVQKEFGGVGAVNHGLADSAGTTAPTLYAGKGFGDLPRSMGLLRPLAVTGELAYQIAEEPVQNLSGGQQFNPNFWNVGFSVQYSLPYLTTQVKDYGWPRWVDGLIPLVEFSYSTPATSPHGNTTIGTIAPGVLAEMGGYQLGIEALIPATRASGNGTGFIVQFHCYLDDLFPKSIGKPLF